MPMALNQQKEQLSLAYIEAICAVAGFSCDKPKVDDDSVDLVIGASGKFGENTIIRSPRIEIQAKATTRQIIDNDRIIFKLPIKNYNDLRGETLIPRLLVVFLLPEEIEDWIFQVEEQMSVRHCAYWLSLQGYEESTNSSTVTVHIPRDQIFSVASLTTLMEKVARRESL